MLPEPTKFAFPLMLGALLAACAPTARPTAAVGSASNTGPERTAVPPTRPTRPATGGFIAPRVMNVPGLEGVIGQAQPGLVSQFGQPRLNVVEGDARKLQFTGEACVLDIYLYPLTPGAQPTATYVEARRASDALDVDRVACVNALRR